jgi:hypothetical protein
VAAPERQAIVTSKENTAQVRAAASLKKEERAMEGAQAMMEYQASGRLIRERMAQLRTLRLNKEAADKKRAVKHDRALKPTHRRSI